MWQLLTAKFEEEKKYWQLTAKFEEKNIENWQQNLKKKMLITDSKIWRKKCWQLTAKFEEKMLITNN